MSEENLSEKYTSMLNLVGRNEFDSMT
jgi:hypothetical protein